MRQPESPVDAVEERLSELQFKGPYRPADGRLRDELLRAARVKLK
jgi:hypothetical protein